MAYVESGYWEAGYAEGDTAPTTSLSPADISAIADEIMLRLNAAGLLTIPTFLALRK